MPAPSEPRSLRLAPDEWDRLRRIGHTWGPIAPLSFTEVVREMLRRTEAEMTQTRPRARTAKETR